MKPNVQASFGYTPADQQARNHLQVPALQSLNSFSKSNLAEVQKYESSLEAPGVSRSAATAYTDGRGGCRKGFACEQCRQTELVDMSVVKQKNSEHVA